MTSKEMELTEFQQSLIANFECKYCHRIFTLEYIIEAFELYGIFFLIGESDCYIGINCPFTNCQKTIAVTVDKTYFHHAYGLFLLFSENSPNAYLGVKKPPDYFSSVCFSFEQFPDLENYNIITWQSKNCRKDDMVCHEMELEDAIAEYNHLTTTHYCSYVPSTLQRLVEKEKQPASSHFLKDIPGMLPPQKQIVSLGTFTVWWFDREEVDEIIALENKKELRIFPRYIVGNPLLEKIDEFCWDYSLRKKYHKELERKNQDPKTGDLYLTTFVGLDVLEIKSSRPEIYPIEEFKKTSNPIYAELENRRKLHKIPMFYEVLSSGINELLCSFTIKRQYAEHDMMVQEIVKHVHDGELLNLLYKKSDEFIADYVKLFQTQGFCYDSVFNLKERYLKDIYGEWKANIIPEKPSLTKRDIAKINCRAIAEKLWHLFPELSIKGMIERPEIQKASLKKHKNPGVDEDGKTYSEPTIRKWIKDLAPTEQHHDPGRPRGKRKRS